MLPEIGLTWGDPGPLALSNLSEEPTMPTMQEDGGLSEADKKRIIAEELLRNHVRNTIQFQELKEMEEAESRENAGVFKRILIYIAVGVVLLVLIIAIGFSLMDRGQNIQRVNSAPAAAAPRR